MVSGGGLVFSRPVSGQSGGLSPEPLQPGWRGWAKADARCIGGQRTGWSMGVADYRRRPAVAGAGVFACIDTGLACFNISASTIACKARNSRTFSGSP